MGSSLDRKRRWVTCWALAWIALLLLPSCASSRTRPEPPLIVATPPPAGEPEPALPLSPAPENPWAGDWEGTGVQNDGQVWPMRVGLTGATAGVCGQVSYPSIPCAGDWICKGVAADGALEIVEHLTDGKERCIDEGTMRVRVGEDGLEWSWQGAGASATALLTRSR
ncbi:MAG: hypothetical protein U0263_37300 [Polyangiaceae bacterium]